MTQRLQQPGFSTRAEPFIEARLLDPTDIHVVDRLASLAGVDDIDVLLGLAFAMRAPRVGHTGVDLLTIAKTAVMERPATHAGGGGDGSGDRPAELVWPEPQSWAARTHASTLVGPRGSPFERLGALIQTGRLADYERRLAKALSQRAGFVPESAIDKERLSADVARLFRDDESSARQRLAGVIATLSRTAVISGGPGTGKTTTVRAVLLLLAGQSSTPLHVALAAPTGKAAARMRESLLEGIPEAVTPTERVWLDGLQAGTLHRLLGWQPHSPSRFRHNRDQPLPHDVVIIDESSMVDIAMMCKLVEAVRPDARLILLGDRNQLASVEAGSVLADLTQLAGSSGTRLSPDAGRRIAAVLGDAATAGKTDPTAPPLAAGMVHFTHAFRFANQKLAAPIAALTTASLTDDPERVAQQIDVALRGLTPATPEQEWSEGQLVGTIHFRPHSTRAPAPGATVAQPATAGAPRGRDRHADGRQLSLFSAASQGAPPALGSVAGPGSGPGGIGPGVIDDIVAEYKRCLAPLRRDPSERSAWLASLRNIEDVRVLCAHRRGPFGVSGLNTAIFDGLRDGVTSRPEDWVGRLVLVSENDYEHDLWNGDVGLVAREHGVPSVIFLRADAVKAVALSAMPRHETAFAMTIHKSQGSQFKHVFVVLPPEQTPILTRELVYTGISRAKASLTLCCSREVLRDALERRVTRASGLAERLAALA